MKTNSLKQLLIILSFFFSIQAQAVTIYVDILATGNNNGTTWIDAYTDLQAAINQSTYGDIVRVSEGIYTKSSSYTLKDGVKIYGGYPNSISIPFLAQYPHHRNTMRNSAQYITVLETTMTGNAGIIFIDYNLSSQTIIDGITLKGEGAVNIQGTNTNFDISPSFNNCVFDGIAAHLSSYCIQIYHYAYLIKPSFKNCVFTNHNIIGHITSVSLLGEISPQFMNCEFTSSTFGLILSGGAPQTMLPYFMKCKFHNLGKVIWALPGSSSNNSSGAFHPKFVNSIFYNNDSIIEIELRNNYNQADTEFSNCSFFNNRLNLFLPIKFNLKKHASSSVTDTNPTKVLRLENCISWNNLNTNGDLMSIDNGMYVEIENTLLEASSSFSNGTSSDPVFVIPNGHPTINRVRDLGNCIYNQNPMFVNPSATGTPNLKLQSTSPARNAGNNTFIPTGATHDYGNTYRIVESIVDIGAYEFCPWAGTCSGSNNGGIGHLPIGGLKIKQDQNESFKEINIYPNPVTNILNIKSELEIISISLLNVQGQEVKKWSNENKLYIGNIPNGLYLLKINTTEGTEHVRIIKE